MGEKAPRTIGIIAPVDAGKTTLVEALLVAAGARGARGRVDHGNAFLDTHALERARGITIFSQCARFSFGEESFILLDTPGHGDFAQETERTLSVLDAAIFLISAADGITGSARTLYRLLRRRNIPCFFFINKLDLPDVSYEAICQDLQESLFEGAVSFCGRDPQTLEEVALRSMGLLEDYLEQGRLDPEALRLLVGEGTLAPIYGGSALYGKGVDELLQGLCQWLPEKIHPEVFHARPFKVHRIAGRRLVQMKILGGSLSVRQPLGEDKVHEILQISGDQVTLIPVAHAGDIVSVAGLDHALPGEDLGAGKERYSCVQTPVMSRCARCPEGVDPTLFWRKLQLLAEEMPELSPQRLPTGSVRLFLMGPLQEEVLRELLKQESGWPLLLEPEELLYRETVTKTVLGIGHFEPLRHYAEVHLELSPEPSLAPLSVHCDLPPATLALAYQHQVAELLKENKIPSVGYGDPLDRMKITLLNGRAHLHHTQSKDFREAAGRALRQGLMRARSLGALQRLEPYYAFDLRLPQEFLGRVLSDLARLSCVAVTHRVAKDWAFVEGRAPVALFREYPQELKTLCRGRAFCECSYGGYELCSQSKEAASTTAVPDEDRYPSGSLFCKGGVGVYVPWDEVEAWAHLPLPKRKASNEAYERPERGGSGGSLGQEEMESILQRTFYANANDRKNRRMRRKAAKEAPAPKVPKSRPICQTGRPRVLVDGHNILYAWPELQDLLLVNPEAAKEKLLDLLENYAGFTDYDVVVVFDAWRVRGGKGSRQRRGLLEVVHTKEGQTADRYIEEAAMSDASKQPVIVATSDLLEGQVAIAAGAMVWNALRFRREVLRERAAGKEHQASGPQREGLRIADRLSSLEEAHLMQALCDEEDPEAKKQDS
ncbi:Ribosome protection-type tetracycline resistance protein, group 2 [Clostridiaceae bacterium JG1575]|nr:Ribosome protection-type tetracycline resistance protein, group 2 [Clostridiaceae bacterium JG1575]